VDKGAEINTRCLKFFAAKLDDIAVLKRMSIFTPTCFKAAVAEAAIAAMGSAASKMNSYQNT
jgi:hypothetical protein